MARYSRDAHPFGNPVGALLRLLIGVGGSLVLASLIALAVTQAPLGSPLFFALAAVPYLVYGLLVRLLLARAAPQGTRALFAIALVFAVAFRAPLLVRPVDAHNDMIRYIYDGRLQRLGYNPFLVLPSDPAVAGTHTAETRAMPSLHARTPYAAAAQLFFRLVVSISESPRAMKLAIVGCDLLTIAVLIAWLRSTRRSPWLALIYAWSPLVILEVAHSGHIDALGALSVAISAWMLSTGRGMRAAIAFVAAVATKLLPIVLLPLFWKRIRLRDALVGLVTLAALYLPFASAGILPLGAVPNVVAHIRFNGPIFSALAATLTPGGAALAAVGAGFGVAIWMRLNKGADEPAAWGWPMAVSLAAAPVVYPWYLLFFTPFLFTRSALPLLVWTYSVFPVYFVWHLSLQGHRWFVPAPLAGLEYGTVVATMAFMTMKRES